MSYLRKIAITIETMELLVNEHPDVIKEELEQNIQNINVLNDIMRNYVKELKSCCEDIEEKYDVMSNIEENNFFFKIARYFWMKRAQRTMKKCHCLLEYSEQLYKKTEKIKVRVNQFKYFS